MAVLILCSERVSAGKLRCIEAGAHLIDIQPSSRKGFARRRLVEICQRSGGDEVLCEKVAIVVTEMAATSSSMAKEVKVSSATL
jgi:hypothetical protein